MLIGLVVVFGLVYIVFGEKAVAVLAGLVLLLGITGAIVFINAVTMH